MEQVRSEAERAPPAPRPPAAGSLARRRLGLRPVVGLAAAVLVVAAVAGYAIGGGDRLRRRQHEHGGRPASRRA